MHIVLKHENFNLFCATHVVFTTITSFHLQLRIHYSLLHQYTIHKNNLYTFYIKNSLFHRPCYVHKHAIFFLTKISKNNIRKNIRFLNYRPAWARYRGKLVLFRNCISILISKNNYFLYIIDF